MNINPFKRIADLEAKLDAMEADYTKRFIELTDHWNRVAKAERKAEQALEAVKILDMQVDNLMSENKARKVGAEYLDKRISALGEDVVLLKALRNVVTPEEVPRKAISTQSAHEQAQIERDRAKQREYNAAYRARKKAKAEAEAKKARQREYKRAWTARKKAALAAAQEAAQ